MTKNLPRYSSALFPGDRISPSKIYTPFIEANKYHPQEENATVRAALHPCRLTYGEKPLTLN